MMHSAKELKEQRVESLMTMRKQNKAIKITSNEKTIIERKSGCNKKTKEKSIKRNKLLHQKSKEQASKRKINPQK